MKWSRTTTISKICSRTTKKTTTTTRTTTSSAEDHEPAPTGVATDSYRLVALGLGGNVGPVDRNFAAALRALTPFVERLEVAPLYLSPPDSELAQPEYLNTVAVGRTHLAAEDLLALAKALEWRAGRRTGPRHGPRPLDIDVLLVEGREERRPELTLPHPRMHRRRFVLQPLADLRPGLRPVPEGPSVLELLASLPPGGALRRRAEALPPLA